MDSQEKARVSDKKSKYNFTEMVVTSFFTSTVTRNYGFALRDIKHTCVILNF